MTSSHVDLLLHFFDVCANQVLYSRQVYPKVAFKLVTCYGNVPVYQVQDTEVRAFIREGLKGLRALLLEEPNVKVRGFQVVLLDGKGGALESYCFGVPSFENDNVQKAQASFRGVLLQLTSRMSDLPALCPDDDLSFTFRLQAQDEKEQEMQSLQWFEVFLPKSDNKSTKTSSVIPVAKSDHNSLRIDAEINIFE